MPTCDFCWRLIKLPIVTNWGLLIYCKRVYELPAENEKNEQALSSKSITLGTKLPK